MRSSRIVASILTAGLTLSCVSFNAQSPSLRQQIESRYALTKATANRDDIVTAGDVIVLQKDKLLMCATTTAVPTQNFYKDGKIQQSALSRFATLKIPGQTASVASRTYVTGEKFWLTGLDLKDDGVVFTVMSDPVGDTRYYGTLKFPYPKGSTPPADQVLAQVAEVLKVQPSDDAAAAGNKQTAAVKAPAQPAAPPARAPMAAIAPPPPPADAPPPAPPTIAIGQTRDQVTAIFGAPTKVVKLAAKEIDYYPDMKVTFVKDKVTNIQ